MSKHSTSEPGTGGRPWRRASTLSAIVVFAFASTSWADSSVRVVARGEDQSQSVPVAASAAEGALPVSTGSLTESEAAPKDMSPASSLVELYDYGSDTSGHKVTPLEWRNLCQPGSPVASQPADARPAIKRIRVTAVPETPDVFTLHFKSVGNEAGGRSETEPATLAAESDMAAKTVVPSTEPVKVGAIPKLVDLFKSRLGDAENNQSTAGAAAAPRALVAAEVDITPIAPEVMFAAKPNMATTPYQAFAIERVQPAIESHFSLGLTDGGSDVTAQPTLLQTDVSVLVEPPRSVDATTTSSPLLHEDYAEMAAPKIASKMMEPYTAHVFEHEPIVDSVPCGPDMTQFLYGCPYYPTQSGARMICGVDCGPYCASCNATWHDARCIPWSLFGPGEYVGPARTVHVSAYHLRVNDLLTLTYIASRQKSAERYRIGVGDRLRIESGTDDTLDREVEVQPDGEITLPLVGDVSAAGKTVSDFREELVERYRQVEREPIITVTPVMVNMALQEILRAVTSQARSAGQALDLRVTPEGTIQAPGIGSVYVQGLTLEELRTELEARYEAAFGPGLLVSPALTERATSYVFVGGEVRTPGRYTLEGPTTVMQAIALAGGWNNGGNVRQVVVFRRDENWCLKATKINLHKPLYGKDPCPVNDVWLRDNDLVLIPKSPILCAADIIELYFTRGIYAVFPINYVYDFSSGSSVVPVGP